MDGDMHLQTRRSMERAHRLENSTIGLPLGLGFTKVLQVGAGCCSLRITGMTKLPLIIFLFSSTSSGIVEAELSYTQEQISRESPRIGLIRQNARFYRGP